MAESSSQPSLPEYRLEELSRRDHVKEVMTAIAVTSGLALLWMMEAVRNRFFDLLDMFGVPAHKRKRGYAFPPGKGRVHRKS